MNTVLKLILKSNNMKTSTISIVGDIITGYDFYNHIKTKQGYILYLCKSLEQSDKATLKNKYKERIDFWHARAEYNPSTTKPLVFIYNLIK